MFEAASFSRSVTADYSQYLTAMQRKTDVACEHFIAISDRKLVDRQNIVSCTLDIFQPKISARALGLHSIEAFEPLQHVPPRLRLLGLLAFKISTNEFFGLSDHRTLILVFALLLFSAKLALSQEF